MEKTFQWKLQGVEGTQAFAEQLAGLLASGDFLALEGDLGAGKTTFTQGLARGLGVRATVNSPTFTIVKEYQGRIPLYHFDVYRVGDDIESIGADDYFFGDGVCVVEWASLVEEVLPTERLTIVLSRIEDRDERLVTLQPLGERYVKLCEEMERNAGLGD